MKLKGQHEMAGHDANVTAAWEFWRKFLAAQRTPLEPIEDLRPVLAYVNEGRWVADCPECDGGIACADWNPQGCCLDCGHVYAVAWPDGDLDKAEEVLLRRPQKYRGWRPDRGETIADLELENAVMLRSTVVEAAPDEPSALIVVEGDITPELALQKLGTGYTLRHDDRGFTEIEAADKTEDQLDRLFPTHKRVG